jgi:hypothetical protein
MSTEAVTCADCGAVWESLPGVVTDRPGGCLACGGQLTGSDPSRPEAPRPPGGAPPDAPIGGAPD